MYFVYKRRDPIFFLWFGLFLTILGLGLSNRGYSYPFATFVMDAQSGEALYSLKADSKLHPASLTKMMTLYLVFNEVESKRMRLDQKIVISKNAVREPPSKFGYKTGQRVSVRYLIRAAAIRSANDAATALGEAVSGSEKEFARYMTQSAKAMGMHNTNFKNANGLTQTGHFSTARDMAILARRLIYDFPEYYHLFGRRNISASGRVLYNTNRKFLASYNGSDGIKTGFTSAAGYNLAASAKRGNKRVIGIVFGSGSVKLRTRRMTELLNIGFSKAKSFKSAQALSPLNLVNFAGNKLERKGVILRSEAPPNRPKDIVSVPAVGKLNITIENLLSLTLERKQVEQKGPIMRPAKMFEGLDNFDFGGKEQYVTKKLLEILENADSKKNYSVVVGSYFTDFNAKKDLTRLTLSDFGTLSKAKRTITKGVVNKKLVFRVTFSNLRKSDAVKACRKLSARNELCEVISDIY